ncbi:hypothetical protein ACIO3O_37715 [Streptomyces sp. NPDC087440]|uniref:hypothetical protein n=1 Tax=Streptomyces sp. NPDC087440 TaxID=3365790 RepID=UPI0037FD2F6D
MARTATDIALDELVSLDTDLDLANWRPNALERIVAGLVLDADPDLPAEEIYNGAVSAAGPDIAEVGRNRLASLLMYSSAALRHPSVADSPDGLRYREAVDSLMHRVRERCPLDWDETQMWVQEFTVRVRSWYGQHHRISDVEREVALVSGLTEPDLPAPGARITDFTGFERADRLVNAEDRLRHAVSRADLRSVGRLAILLVSLADLCEGIANEVTSVRRTAKGLPTEVLRRVQPVDQLLLGAAVEVRALREV